MEIKLLRKQGKSVRAFARELGVSRNTVRKYLSQPDEPPSYAPRQGRASKLDPYKAYIGRRIEQAHPKCIPATVIYRELKAQGYPGKERIVRAYMSSLKPRAGNEPLVRYETVPGEQMQVDWAVLSRRPQRFSAFVATLGWSRYSYVEIVEDEKLERLLQCHINAFDYLGGVVKKVLYDNAKTVVLQRHAYGEGLHRFHPALWDMAGHYGFIPKLCQPYRPQTKGKVERFIRYLKESFFIPFYSRYLSLGELLDVRTANVEVLRWLREVANVRLHRGLGQQPQVLWQQEQSALQTLPPPYCGSVVQSGSAMVPYDRHAYLQHPLSVYDGLLNEEVV